MTYVEKAFNSPEAKMLADLAGIDEDLQHAIAICDKLLDIWHQIPTDEVVIEALSTAVLVRYCRCFTSGVRQRLPEVLLASLSPTHRRLHEVLRDLRDKYIAHSVSPFEENIVTVEVTAQPGTQRLVDVSVDHRRFAGLKPDMLIDIRGLASALSDQVSAQLSAERCRILEVLRLLPADIVDQLPDVPDVPDNWRATSSRRAI